MALSFLFLNFGGYIPGDIRTMKHVFQFHDRLGLAGKAKNEARNGFLAKVAGSLKGRVQP